MRPLVNTGSPFFYWKGKYHSSASAYGYEFEYDFGMRTADTGGYTNA